VARPPDALVGGYAWRIVYLDQGTDLVLPGERLEGHRLPTWRHCPHPLDAGVVAGLHGHHGGVERALHALEHVHREVRRARV